MHLPPWALWIAAGFCWLITIPYYWRYRRTRSIWYLIAGALVVAMAIGATLHALSPRRPRPAWSMGLTFCWMAAFAYANMRTGTLSKQERGDVAAVAFLFFCGVTILILEIVASLISR